MDQLDKKLYNDLNSKIEIPNELDTVIKNGLNKKKSNVLSFKKNCIISYYNFCNFRYSFCWKCSV